MANTMRWRYGDTNPVMLAVDSATEIEIGDLIYLDADDAKAASALADAGTLLLNQTALHDAFVGVAMQCSKSGDTSDVRVATSGVFEFDCTADTFEVGDLLGADEAASGTELAPQVAIAVEQLDAAIGRCAKRAPTATTRVLVDIASTVMRGGVQGAA